MQEPEITTIGAEVAQQTLASLLQDQSSLATEISNKYQWKNDKAVAGFFVWAIAADKLYNLFTLKSRRADAKAICVLGLTEFHQRCGNQQDFAAWSARRKTVPTLLPRALEILPTPGDFLLVKTLVRFSTIVKIQLLVGMPLESVAKEILKEFTDKENAAKPTTILNARVKAHLMQDYNSLFKLFDKFQKSTDECISVVNQVNAQRGYAYKTTALQQVRAMLESPTSLASSGSSLSAQPSQLLSGIDEDDELTTLEYMTGSIGVRLDDLTTDNEPKIDKRLIAAFYEAIARNHDSVNHKSITQQFQLRFSSSMEDVQQSFADLCGLGFSQRVRRVNVNFITSSSQDYYNSLLTQWITANVAELPDMQLVGRKVSDSLSTPTLSTADADEQQTPIPLASDDMSPSTNTSPYGPTRQAKTVEKDNDPGLYLALRAQCLERLTNIRETLDELMKFFYDKQLVGERSSYLPKYPAFTNLDWISSSFRAGKSLDSRSGQAENRLLARYVEVEHFFDFNRTASSTVLRENETAVFKIIAAPHQARLHLSKHVSYNEHAKKKFAVDVSKIPVVNSLRMPVQGSAIINQSLVVRICANTAACLAFKYAMRLREAHQWYSIMIILLRTESVLDVGDVLHKTYVLDTVLLDAEKKFNNFVDFANLKNILGHHSSDVNVIGSSTANDALLLKDLRDKLRVNAKGKAQTVFRKLVLDKFEEVVDELDTN